MPSERPRYRLGDKVQILDLKKAGHVRTPFYIRGKFGTINHDCGDFENPEHRAYGRVGLPRIRLYRVKIMQKDIWPDYAGSPTDSLVIEIYDHWLRPAEPIEQAA
jgi:nitrile hydratase beta subunit-like protein